VSVTLDVGDEVVLRVVDDGTGLAEGEGRRSGLANLEERAGALSGSFGVSGGAQGGTALVWRVPRPT
jgi:signal transduction histidine kinase